MEQRRDATILNIAEVLWQEFPGHHGGALSKALVGPGNTGSQLIDYRISSYAPMARVERHSHRVQEQVYHVIEGEGLFEFGGESRVVRRHDVMFIPPGVEHGLTNTGLGNLVFLVVTTPILDE